jgi:hypothetical protein
MTNIRINIEKLWTFPLIKSLMEFRNRAITVSDLAYVSSTIITVSFIGCHSKEWRQIGERLATLPQLKTLSAEHCDSEDSLCAGVCGSKWLTSVRMGK